MQHKQIVTIQRKFTLPICLDAGFRTFNILLVLLSLSLLFQSYFNKLLYIVIQQFIDINIKLIYFIRTEDKPHNNAVYVFEYFYSLKVATDGSRNT